MPLSNEDIEWLKAQGINTEESGLIAEEESVDHIEYIIEPRLWPAWLLFNQLDTQWQYAGMDGTRAGLKGEVLIEYCKLQHTKHKKALKLFDQVIEISRGALKGFAELRDG